MLNISRKWIREKLAAVLHTYMKVKQVVREDVPNFSKLPVPVNWWTKLIAMLHEPNVSPGVGEGGGEIKQKMAVQSTEGANA